MDRTLINLGLYFIGYGILCWSEGWVVALAVFFIQWAGNIDWKIKYEK